MNMSAILSQLPPKGSTSDSRKHRWLLRFSTWIMEKKWRFLGGVDDEGEQYDPSEVIAVAGDGRGILQ